MHIKAIIVADDLTGALDTSTPFSLAGRSVACATRPPALSAAIASGAEIIVVNTASRGLPAEEAVTAIEAVAKEVLTVAPPIVFKKIDSRLKGNIATETIALAEALGFHRILVAPAVPDQGRMTVGGCVVGRGVTSPMEIAPLFAHSECAVHVADAATEADLDRIVRETDWLATLAVGARGLGAALARLHPGDAISSFVPDRRTLFAIGSRDPITDNQIAALDGVDCFETSLGELASWPGTLPAVIRETGPQTGRGADARFASTVVDATKLLRPHTLLMSGGDTAQAILDHLGVDLVFPRGEAISGLPWFVIPGDNQPDIRAVVKSGGFGDRGALAALLPEA